MRPHRFFGGAIVAGALLTLVGNSLHPILPLLDVDAYAQAATGAPWMAVHAALLAGAVVLTLGFVHVARELRRNGEGSLSVAGLFAVVLGSVFWSLLFVLDGFVGARVASEYAAATGAERETLGAILRFSESLVLHLVVLAFLLTGIGVGLVAGSMWIARLYPRPLAAAGVAVSLVLVLGYAAGVYGPFFAGNLVTTAVAAGLLIWSLAVGALVVRGPGPARGPQVAGGGT